MEDKGGQDFGRRTRQQREARRKADAPTKEARRSTIGDTWRQDPRKGEHAIHMQQKETRRVTMGSKGRQDPREGGEHWETKEDKTLGKADTPSKKGHNGKQDPHHPTRRYCGRPKGTRPSGRQRHNPTPRRTLQDSINKPYQYTGE